MAKSERNDTASIAAPTLMDLIRDTGKSAYLRQKGLSNKIRKDEKWKYRFIVLVNTAMYVYEDETSGRPLNCINLIGYNCVQRIESDKCRFGFAISSLVKSKTEEIFACPSDNERRSWMRKIKEQLCKSNNAPSPGFLFEIEDNADYVSIEEPVELQDDSCNNNSKSSFGILSRGSKKSSRRNAITDMDFLEDRRS